MQVSSRSRETVPNWELGRQVAVVLDGEHRAALAIVRSLGRKGLVVHVGSQDKRSIAGGSRFATSETQLPDPMKHHRAYGEAVHRLVASSGASLLIPVTEASILSVLENPLAAGRAQVPFPDLAHFLHASDKAHVLSLADGLGISIPEQWVVQQDERDNFSLPEGHFPVAIKASRSVSGPSGSRSKSGSSYASTLDELQTALGDPNLPEGPILVQARIEGPGLGVFILRWEGQIVASFAHRRVREKPPSGGVSVCSESVELPRSLYSQSAALLEALDWTGVAMVEYKHDVHTGRNVLMEVNPRFWGSLQLAIDAGVDFPWYLVQLALGQSVTPVHAWRHGVRCRWRLGELDHLLARLRRSRTELDLSPSTPGLLQTVLATLSPPVLTSRGEVFRFGDPVPGLRELASWVGDLRPGRS